MFALSVFTLSTLETSCSVCSTDRKDGMNYPAYCDVRPLSVRKPRNSRKRIVAGIVLIPVFDLVEWLARGAYYMTIDPIVIVVRNNKARRQRELAAGSSL